MKTTVAGVKIPQQTYPPHIPNAMLFAKSVLPLLCEWDIARVNLFFEFKPFTSSVY